MRMQRYVKISVGDVLPWICVFLNIDFQVILGLFQACQKPSSKCPTYAKLVKMSSIHRHSQASNILLTVSDCGWNRPYKIKNLFTGLHNLNFVCL